MTICFFSAQYLPTVGGVERYTYNLAKRVAAAGHTALVVTSALPGLPPCERTPEGITVYRLPAWLFMAGRFPVPRPGRAFRALARQLWGQPIHLCVIQTRFYVSSLYAARQAKRRGIPALVIDHSTGHMPMGNGPVGWAAHGYEHLACRYIRCKGPAFYGVSQAVCQWLRHFGVQPAGTLYNAVDPAELRAIARAPSATDWRKALGLAPGQPLVAFAGRIIPEKGVGELLRAFEGLEVPGAALAVAGDGPLLPALRAQCPPGVSLLGSLPYEQTLQLFAQADLYCLPTRYAEGFPTTFLEAAACGCPIVTSHTGGSGELLPDESYGIQLEAPDARHIRAALQAALAPGAAGWRAQAAQKTAARLERYFTWDAVASQLLALARQAQGENTQ